MKLHDTNLLAPQRGRGHYVSGTAVASLKTRGLIQPLFSGNVEDSCKGVIDEPDAKDEVNAMRKAVVALAALGAVATAAIANPTAAEARRGWWGPAVIGGLAAGAIVGSALARPYPYYGYGYYAPAPVYYDYYTPPPAYYSYYGPPRYPCSRYRYRYRAC